MPVLCSNSTVPITVTDWALLRIGQASAGVATPEAQPWGGCRRTRARLVWRAGALAPSHEQAALDDWKLVVLQKEHPQAIAQCKLHSQGDTQAVVRLCQSAHQISL